MKKLVLPVMFLLFVWMAFSACSTVPGSGKEEPDSPLFDAVMRLTANSSWKLVDKIHLNFPTCHPQGLIKTGDDFFVSTVHVTTPISRDGYPDAAGYDRSTGAGIGYLVKFDRKGNKTAEVELGEGTMYHPGGIDFDGQDIWVPVAEYRPNSQAIVYKVNAGTMNAVEVFRYKDHIGGVVHDLKNKTINGVSWGSRRFYTWPISASGQVDKTDVPREELWTLNPQYYIDYQDCHYIGNGKALCSGLQTYTTPTGQLFGLSGIEILDLKTSLILHQVPVKLFSDETGNAICQNPFWLDANPDGTITAYFIPDDDDSYLYVFSVSP
ncbi:MAG: DUF6454 family protein [Tannerella sp.]|jgi:hypothetical protein|nr:DUF6454 family protein [Tannerella sp.]